MLLLFSGAICVGLSVSGKTCTRRATATSLACALGSLAPQAALARYKPGRLTTEAIEANYLAAPVDVSSVDLPAGVRGQRDVVLIFHGRGGEDRETELTRDTILAEDRANNVTRPVVVYNWERCIDPSPNRLFLGAMDVGSKLGRALSAERQLRSLHIIGTSAGGFVADSCCKEYVERASRRGGPRAKIRLSLCDPFTQPDAKPGTLDWFLCSDAATIAAGRAAGQFGLQADFAEHYLNADDPVPSTSTPLANCFVYDVTRSSEKRSFPLPGGGESSDRAKNFILWSLGYHNFPMAYFAEHYRTLVDAEGRVRFPSHEELPRGTVVQVD